ncbi:MAG: response regulator [Desulfomonile tiedjei]|nr:response regulator [Desulfomonile tiedjei]
MLSYRVLIVDDEEEFVETIVKRLKDRGLAAEGVTSGRQALDLMETKDFDVVILDVKMPGMDGIETLRVMKTRRPLTEVIMLTGHGSVDSGIQGLQLGAYNYVMKPVPLDELLEQMNQAYERKLIEEDRKSRDEGEEAAHSH